MDQHLISSSLKRLRSNLLVLCLTIFGLVPVAPNVAHAGNGGNGSGGAILYLFPRVRISQALNSLAASVEQLDQTTLKMAGAPSNWTSYRIAKVIRSAQVGNDMITQERMSSGKVLDHDASAGTITVYLEFGFYFGALSHVKSEELTRQMHEMILKEVALLWEADEAKAAEFAAIISFRIQALKP